MNEERDIRIKTETARDYCNELGLEFLYWDSYRQMVVYKNPRPHLVDWHSFKIMVDDSRK